MSQELEISDQDIGSAWGELQAVPSYVETQAASFANRDLSQLVAEAMQARYEQVQQAQAIIADGLSHLNVPFIVLMEDVSLHSASAPFCADASCPCHHDDALFDECILGPVIAGTMRIWDALELLWPGQ